MVGVFLFPLLHTFESRTLIPDLWLGGNMGIPFRFFAALLFLSAFLLFFIQPLVSRHILPVLGGTPAVWTTSMLFFQALLLGGYAWAHLIVRLLPPWAPPIIQIFIACTGLFFMNTSLPAFDQSGDITDPVSWQLSTMAIMVGIPYFALATNAPLYQAVYDRFKTKQSVKTPYALYSISNIGSFLALLSYPFIIEPALSLRLQGDLWQCFYALLCGLIVITGCLCLFCVWRHKNVFISVKNDPAAPANKNSVPPLLILSWVALSFIPSSLMLGVTAHITTDIASIPMFWIIPLAFYIGSFVLAFADPPGGITRHESFFSRAAFIMAAIILVSMAMGFHKLPWIQVAFHYSAFFVIACLCHLKLAQRKPASNHLTLFYLIISIGGCLGGIFNALIAYRIFSIPMEYPAVIALMTVILAILMPRQNKGLGAYINMSIIAALCAVFIGAVMLKINWAQYCTLLVLGGVMIWHHNYYRVFAFAAVCVLGLYAYHKTTEGGRIIHRERNVFGSLVVKNVDDDVRYLVHGTTLHGMQKLPLAEKPVPSSYYHPKGPLGDIFSILDKRSNKQQIAGLGLGVGTIACYTAQQRHFDFFEIDSAVADIARNPDYFTYLSSCAPDASIMIGDARIGIDKQKNAHYDMILVDTFSSDAIPVHLLTKEAVEIYLDKIKNGGFLVFHISNRYFDLRPVIAAIARDTGARMIYKNDDKPQNASADEWPKTRVSSAYAVLVTDQNAPTSQGLVDNGMWEFFDENTPLPRAWTDDYVNIFSALRP